MLCNSRASSSCRTYRRIWRSLTASSAASVVCRGKQLPGSILGWHLVEGDLTAVGQHVAEWADLLECEVYPVVDDAGAANAVKGMVGTE
jgi:hypothetical protein